MTTLVRFFEPDNDSMTIEYENVVIPPIGTQVYLSNTPYVVGSLIYDYGSADREEHAYVMVDVNLRNIQNIDCSDFATEEE